MEKAVFRQIVKYTDDNNLIHENHHGSRKGHSTTTAMIEMYSTWLEAHEKGEISGVMMLDLSAAFDLVNYDILLQKLRIMGFGNGALSWFRSYLMDRSQCVYIDGKTSDLTPVTVGVPQGSVLGALLYILYVNDLPAAIHDLILLENPPQSRLSCLSCGSMCCYVDDSTYTFSSKDPQELSRVLSTQYKQLADYFRDNRLIINNEKTHLLVMGTHRHAHLRASVEVDTGPVTKKPAESGRLLGANVTQSLKWKQHLLDGDNSLIATLSKRLNALIKLTSRASFKTRLMLANAIFMSVLNYMIVLWGGSEQNLIKMIQTSQNRAARYVTQQSWYTPTRKMLKQCGWLSIKQMIFFNSVLQIWKTLDNQAPSSVFSKLRLSNLNTRSRANRSLVPPLVHTALAQYSFISRAVSSWNLIPGDLRQLSNENDFKSKLKLWVRENIEL